VREAGELWLTGAKEGTVRTRSGHRYKPSALLRYGTALRHNVFPELGARRLSDLQRLDLQDLADRLLAGGLAPGSVRNALMPLRAILRRAVTRGELAVNPSVGLELPASLARRERIATPAEAVKLLAALPPPDQVLWPTLFYTGVRRGEAQALRWQDVDFAGGILRVERAYDDKAKLYVAPKSAAGRRSVPIPGELRQRLLEHRLADLLDAYLAERR
jgi:integrase